MYTIQRLQNLVEYSNEDNVEHVLAKYFLNHLNHISSITLTQCIDETGVSKASIHRFYSRGGFNNFKALLTVLEREYHHNMNSNDISAVEVDTSKQIKLFIKSLQHAKRILLYGREIDIRFLDPLKYHLIKDGKTVLSCNIWNKDMVEQRINQLDHNDVFIVVDTSMKIQNLIEMSMNRSYLLDLRKLVNLSFSRFFIGKANCMNYQGFENISVQNQRDFLYKICQDIIKGYGETIR